MIIKNAAKIKTMPPINLHYPASIQSGKLKVPEEELRRDLKKIDECLFAEVIIREVKKEKTAQQNKAFHGTIIDQVQAFEMATNGEYKSRDRIKQDLKNAFLPKEKQYYSDGSPVLINIPHPEKKGVFYRWHYEKPPSLADLSLDEFRAFIDAILSHYLHECGLTIIIESELKTT